MKQDKEAEDRQTLSVSIKERYIHR